MSIGLRTPSATPDRQKLRRINDVCQEQRSFRQSIPTCEDNNDSPLKSIIAPGTVQLNSHNHSNPSLSATEVDSSSRSSETEIEPRLSSLEVLYAARPNVKSSTNYSVIKITNINHETTPENIRDMFHGFKRHIPHGHLPPGFTHATHLILGKATGRPQSTAFIEIPDLAIAKEALEYLGKTTRGPMCFQMSTQNELISSLLPCWEGTLVNGQFVADLYHKGWVNSFNIDGKTFNDFVDRLHITTILNACKPKVKL